MKRAALLLVFAVACERAPNEVTAPRALHPVALEAVAQLERELGPAAPPSAPDADLVEHVTGLVDTLGGGDEGLRRLAREELVGLGPAAVPLLATWLTNTDANSEARGGAARALASFDSVAAAEALLARLELARTQVDAEGWMRAHCAWRLGETTQDWCVPRLLLHLRYETDHETVIWSASTLAHFGNFAGLDALYVIADTARTQELRDTAAETLARLAREHGCADGAELLRAWNTGDPSDQLPDAEFSPRHRLEIWRIVRDFSQWQLRGVDDGRFALTREQRRIAPLLGRALEDSDRYVRTHAAQCLERLGGRGRGAGAALQAALVDAEIEGQVLLALGAVGYAPAEGALIERLAPGRPLEIRVAAANGLGRLALASSAAALRPLADADGPLDLRVAAACALVECAPADAPHATLELLVRHLTSGAIASAGPERALERWLAERAAREPASGAALLEAWRAIRPDDPRERVTQRAALLAARLDELAPPR